MTRFIYAVEGLSVWTGRAFGWCIMILTLSVSYEVFVRYVLNAPTVWAFDMMIQMYGALFLMAGPYALAQDSHVRGDVLYRLFSVKWQARVDFVLYILFFFPGMLALFWYGWEIAAAGRHHLFMVGPPGAGKSMLAARLPGILPPLKAAEALETSMIQSLAGLLSDGGISRTRPFREPHHTASTAAMIGGGRGARPGEISLAHNGVLFMDEFPEFARTVLDTLRQPIETGEVVVARANAHVRYPCRFLLIAAANPCKCGHFGDAARACSRAPGCAEDYLGRISGPLMDRFDLRIEVPPVGFADLDLPASGDSSATVAARVAAARAVQNARFSAHPATRTNAEAEGAILEQIAGPDAEGRDLLTRAAERFGLSARAYHRILRVARTVADLDGSEHVRKPHLAEAISFRLTGAAG